jgi:outer membrane protein OmpA-like peptidoglycan-associated protein
VVVKAKACEEQLTSLAAAGQIHFRVGSANLDSLSIPTLNRLAEAANSCPDMSIEVSGHTSAEGGQQHNQQLSLRRAQSVVRYLVRAGVEASRLQSAGYGASRPAAPNDSDANMAKNRRIEFTVRPR